MSFQALMSPHGGSSMEWYQIVLIIVVVGLIGYVIWNKKRNAGS
jgi:hypothetical protein